jgi:hypothetical protein
VKKVGSKRLALSFWGEHDENSAILKNALVENEINPYIPSLNPVENEPVERGNVYSSYLKYIIWVGFLAKSYTLLICFSSFSFEFKRFYNL